MRGETFHFRHNHAIGIVGIPHIVVLETIHVDVQTVGVHVHVSDEELCDAPSVSLHV